MKPRSRFRGYTLFVTVGSTKFDKLIAKILTDKTIQQLVDLDFIRLILQVGKSEYKVEQLDQIKKNHNLDIEVYDYKSSIIEDIERADIVVGHAGAGTCLEVLRMNKRLMIVVNDDLMDNHQKELADQLAGDKFVLQTNVDNFDENLALLCDGDTKLEKFPPKDFSKFEEIFNEALKKVSSRL